MNEIGRRIADKLIEIYRSADFTITFLPYKRSMWDSMESVYEECRSSGAKTYCVPIPYYRMKAGREIDYIDSDRELFEYGQDVSLLKDIKSDFCVIHYPYDSNNSVTRMLPEYHTAELKKYGAVVYIPYSQANVRFLRVQPGIANVDYAFLNTEQECGMFIKEWQDLGVDFTGRVFGFGSPKIDAARKCIKPAGDIKVTLVLNSLAPFLREPFIKISQYKDVITGELVAGRSVIFRPHPLLRQTIKSLRPDTGTAYDEFCVWMRSVDVLIDESEYLEMALMNADYLVSDHSSVLEMWQITGREYRIL